MVRDGFTIGLTTGLLSKKLLFIILQPVNQTDKQIKVWMVVRLDYSDRRMPIWLNSWTMRVAVLRSQPHNRASSTLDALNCSGCRTTE